TAPAPPATGASLLVGANLHLFFRPPITSPGEALVSPKEADALVDRMKSAGANAIRVAVHWPLLEPEEGRRSAGYSKFVNGVLDHARARGLAVVLAWGGIQCGHGAAPQRPEPRCATEQGRQLG